MGGSKWEKRFIFDVSSDVTPVPNLLLKYYRHLGLSESELVFLIQIMRLRDNGCPPVEEIAERLGMGLAQVKQNMASLIEKEIVVTESFKYYFDGLYDKLMDFWACQMAGDTDVAVITEEGKPSDRKSFSQVYNAFEKEFGRVLSPMENEKIIEWLDKLHYNPEIVLESLKRSVLRGIYNFNYIDRILMEWQKANVRTLHEINKFENDKRMKEKNGRRKPAPQVRSTRLKNLYEM